MKYLQITDLTTPSSTTNFEDLGYWKIFNIDELTSFSNIKKISFINHSPQYCLKKNFMIMDEGGIQQFFITEPNQILEITEKYSQNLNISRIGVFMNENINNSPMKFNITIGYED